MDAWLTFREANRAENTILTWMIIIIGSWSAAVTLRDGRWLFVVVPALALLAALQESGSLLHFISQAPREIASGILLRAFAGTIVGGIIAGVVRLRLVPLGASKFRKTGVAVPALAVVGAGLAACLFNWFAPVNYGPVVGPAMLIWLLCWLFTTRRHETVAPEGGDAWFKLTMVGLAVLLTLEGQLQLAVEAQTCGPWQCGGRFVGALDHNPYPFWDKGILGFLPQPSPDLVPQLIYLPMVLAAALGSAILLALGRKRMPRTRAIAMSAVAAVSVGYGTPTYEYFGWSHYPTPTLGIGL